MFTLFIFTHHLFRFIYVLKVKNDIVKYYFIKFQQKKTSKTLLKYHDYSYILLTFGNLCCKVKAYKKFTFKNNYINKIAPCIKNNLVFSFDTV